MYIHANKKSNFYKNLFDVVDFVDNLNRLKLGHVN